MEGGATVGLNNAPLWKSLFQYGRIFIIAFAVSLTSIPHFLSGVTFSAVTHDMKDSLTEWREQQRIAHIFYTVVGILAHAFFAFTFQKYSRKTCLYFVCICQLTTSVLLLCSRSYWLLQTSRAFSAIGDIGAEMFCIIYISEISPDEVRGSLVAIHKLLYGFANLIPIFLYLINVPFKIPFSCISIVVSLLVAIWTFFGVPESPVYFLRKEDVTGAKKSLEFLYGSEADISHVIVNKKKILKATRSDLQSTTSVFQECTSRRTLTFSALSMSLLFLRAILLFGTKLHHIDGTLWRLPEVSENRYWYILLINGFLIILGNLFVLALCDRVGRKILLLVSSVACSMCFVGFGILSLLFHKLEFDSWFTIIVIDTTFNSIYLFSANFGANVIPDVYISDIFPSKILNVQLAVLGSFQICVEYIIHYEIYSLLITYLIGLSFWWSFAGLSLFVTLFLMKFLTETKCRPSGFVLMDSEESVLYSSLQENDE